MRELGSPCAAALYIEETPLFALADGTVHRGTQDDHGARAHSALLVASATVDGDALLTGGEDGRVCRIEAVGEPVEIACLPRKWIDSVAAGPQGLVAFASGRSVWLLNADGPLRELQHPRSVAGVAFSPDGARIAVARYGGITVHDLAGASAPAELEWKGIYTGLTYAPDGRFLLAFMQDAVLHGWRLPENGQPARHFRMTGYAARIRDWSWSADGRWLATSGAQAAIVWPFDGADGPMGRTALELGAPRGEVAVSAVACHPALPLVAIGYGDGALALASINDPLEESTLRESGRAAVSTVSWHNGGLQLAFGTEAGECGVLDVPR